MPLYDTKKVSSNNRDTTMDIQNITISVGCFLNTSISNEVVIIVNPINPKE